MTHLIPTPEYESLLSAIKARVEAVRRRVASSVNSELVILYWHVGHEILRRQREMGWGTQIVERLSLDLRRSFPEMKGWSVRNLQYMRSFAETWAGEPIVQQAVAQIPWGHIVRILDRAKGPQERDFYVQQTIAQGWSRDALAIQMRANLYQRQGAASTNFPKTLPEPNSALATAALKDPYMFDFLGLGEDAHEREIERAMIRHIRDTLLEFGRGFAFVGNQVRLEVAGEEYFLDLLFYHVKLHSYVVVELKATEFKPEHAGKLNFYLSAVDDLFRDARVDGATIGLLLCRTKNRVIVEYALRDVHKPVGVADLQLTRLLPEELTCTLPTVEEIEQQLSGDGEDGGQANDIDVATTRRAEKGGTGAADPSFDHGNQAGDDPDA